MDNKKHYEAPTTDLVNVRLEGSILNESIASVKGANYSGWDSDEEAW